MRKLHAEFCTEQGEVYQFRLFGASTWQYPKHRPTIMRWASLRASSVTLAPGDTPETIRIYEVHENGRDLLAVRPRCVRQNRKTGEYAPTWGKWKIERKF